MMSFDLLLDSSLAKLQSDGERNVSHDFTIHFPYSIYLDSEKNYKAALDGLITMSYSWYNIDASFDNNKIRWRKKTEAWQTLTFPNGMYDYKDINHFLQSHTGKVDPKDKDSDFIYNLYFDMTIYRVVILMHEDYELDLSQGSFSELLGYRKSILSGDSVGKKVPNITRGVDWVFIHCHLINRISNNVPSDVLYSFSTADLQVSYPFQKVPHRIKWHPVNKSVIRSIRISVTDGRGNPLDLNGIDVALSLMIEKE